MATTIQRTKTEHKGYWQSGYGRGFKDNVCVYLINGKLYAKDSKNANTVFMSNEVTEMGYVPVNLCPIHKKCHQVSNLKEHELVEGI